MKYTLVIMFLTAVSEKNALSISGIKSTLTKSEVNALMDVVITKNIFKTNSDDLVKKYGAQLTQRQVTKYETS